MKLLLKAFDRDAAGIKFNSREVIWDTSNTLYKGSASTYGGGYEFIQVVEFDAPEEYDFDKHQ